MTNYDITCEIITSLNNIHDKMLDLLLAGELEVADFHNLNALYKQIEALSDRLAPKYEPLTFANIIANTGNKER